MTVSYLTAAAGVLACTASVVRTGGTIAFAEGEVTDQNGAAVCRAVGTYRILRPLRK
jgi:acyl-coenzyme A thioesterase PaaI-like protein